MVEYGQFGAGVHRSQRAPSSRMVSLCSCCILLVQLLCCRSSAKGEAFCPANVMVMDLWAAGKTSA